MSRQTIRKEMVIATRGYSQLQRSYQRVAGLLERNRISNEGIELVDKRDRGTGTLTHRKKRNNGSSHFTSVFCQSIECHCTSRTIFVLQPSWLQCGSAQ
ncbi:hypothetical protein EVAR_100014_1 [Eumeta japonica]|uniref:Uncharacterized protein n=1 Tax=Eumeta variegata TaxID=151549 RepID=A0A4C1ZNU4_EUMVA|nr:hypothetical protein EVAR_100014_1 [Eumeta japonica]